jgi:hypothetical protein
MYENGTMSPVETVLKRGEGGINEKYGGVNLVEIYYKYFCKCHNVPLVQL